MKKTIRSVLISTLLIPLSFLTAADHLVETQNSVKDRIKFDINKIKVFVGDSNLSNKANLITELNTLNTQADALVYPLDEAGFKATLPFDITLHHNVFKVYSKVLNLYMSNQLLVWHTAKNTKLGLYETPKNNLSDLDIRLMNNEYRYETFNISNGSNRSQEINLTLNNIPNNTTIKVFKGEFVDDRRIDSLFSSSWKERLPGGTQNKGGTDALVELFAPYKVSIPSGTTKQITLLVKTNNTLAGDYPVTIHLAGNDISTNLINLNLHVSPIKLSKKDYSLTMYDYIAENIYAVSNNNQEAMKETFNSHYGDTPKVVLSAPRRGTIDAKGLFLGSYDFSALDRAINLFPNAKGYFISVRLNSSYTFAGVNFFGKEWSRAMGTWMKALSKHMIEQGKDPSQLIISVAHEPRSLDKIAKGLKFAKAIKQYAPEITTAATIYAKAAFSTGLGQELIENLDVVIIARHHYYGDTSEPNRLTPEAKTFYSSLQANSNWTKELWFYGTLFSAAYSSEDRLLHLTRDFYNNANGSGYWSLSDNAKNPTGWNMYPRYRAGKRKTRYTPLYIDDTTVTTSRQWEAMREAQQNNKYAIMLRNIVQRLETEHYAFDPIQKSKIDDALNIVPLTAEEVETKRLEILSLIEALNNNGHDINFLLKVKNGEVAQRWNQVGEVTTIKAVAPTIYHIFEHWYSIGGGTIADANKSTTTFTMPENFARVTASFKYIGNEDADHDGILNFLDSDSDNDGVIDELDAFPFDPLEIMDTDGNGIGNNADLDDDGDGFSDEDELAAGTDPLDKNDYSGTNRILKIENFNDFGEVKVGEEKSQILTISNTGNTPLTISEIVYLHPSNKNVFHVENWSGEIAPGGSKSITVTYKPIVTAVTEASIYIRSNKTRGTFTQTLRGEGISDAPVCTRILKFMTRNGTTFNPGETKTITIANLGRCNLTIGRIRFHSKIDQSYSVTGLSIPSKIIAPNEQLDINITFVPNAIEPSHNGLVYFHSDKTNYGERSQLLKGN